MSTPADAIQAYVLADSDRRDRERPGLRTPTTAGRGLERDRLSSTSHSYPHKGPVNDNPKTSRKTSDTQDQRKKPATRAMR